MNLYDVGLNTYSAGAFLIVVMFYFMPRGK